MSGGWSSDGQQIVDTAMEYIGYPYVWGGTSLTNGCDCSHFAHLILDLLGIEHGGYGTSDTWVNKGELIYKWTPGDPTSVLDILDMLEPGDIISQRNPSNTAGHVAIYDGDGMVVEAKGSKWGITHDRRIEEICNSSKGYWAINRFT